MFTLEDYAGKRGPFRDERGRFRRRTWDEMGILGRANRVLAAELVAELKRTRDFWKGDRRVRVVDADAPVARIRLPGDR